jgi:hypothetical protein
VQFDQCYLKRVRHADGRAERKPRLKHEYRTKHNWLHATNKTCVQLATVYLNASAFILRDYGFCNSEEQRLLMICSFYFKISVFGVSF